MDKNLNLYVCDTSRIAKDFKELSYDDLVEILRLNEEESKGVTYDAAINFVTKLIEIKNQEKLLKINKNLVLATWFLAIASIILATVSLCRN